LDTNSNSTCNKSKPPEYDEALAYCKSAPPEDNGYPEPSLVDESQPPSYDAVFK